jgi:hypothetical protein
VLQNEFALKVADPDKTDDLTFPLREFGLMRDIGHPNVVRVEWAGRVLPVDGAPAYLLMEQLEGRMLDEVIADGPLATEQAVDWTTQLLDALIHIHPADGTASTPGVLHRDIKPANILIAERGPVLLDFSSAIRVEDSGSAPVGTLRYSPPDISDGGWDASGDLFAVGCTLYEMLTQESPWGEQAPSLATVPTSITEHLPDLPEALASVIDRSVASHRDDRFATAQEFSRKLESAGTRHRTQYNPTPHVSDAIKGAGSDIWTASFVEELSQTEHPQAVLYEAMRSFTHRDVPDSEEDIERAFVDGEARALVLERPLPQVAPSFYDALLEPTVPAFLETHGAPAVFEIKDDDVVLVLDGLGYFEVAKLMSLAAEDGCKVREAVWTAGATNPARPEEGLRALHRITSNLPDVEPVSDVSEMASAAVSKRALRLVLPEGERGDDGLPSLLTRRSRIIRDSFAAVCDATDLLDDQGGRLIITSTWGVIYLGHGLRRDVGASMGASADRVRALWSAAFPEGRVGRTDQALRSDMYRPYRDVQAAEFDTRRFAVGRLAWPDRPDAPRLASGGMSLPERLLPFLVIAAD